MGAKAWMRGTGLTVKCRPSACRASRCNAHRRWIEPHASLRVQASDPTLTGLREDYVCGTCGRRMVRFLAQQTNPVPSDVWRFERDAVTDRPESADPTQHAVAEPSFEPDSEIDSPDECAS